ncbi:MAG: hypothetical protein WDN26_01715 [Chitinophagaceae bacterium]
MKLLFLITVMLSAGLSGFYDISFETLEGATVQTSAYKGKKIVIAVISASQESLPLIHYLDSLQRTTDSIKVIAVPTGDFGGNVNLADLSNLKANLGIVITKPLSVKIESTGQHPLFAWLTDMQQNKHFNMDVAGEGQVFIISAQGTLYSVLPKSTPTRIITRIVSQSFTK